MNRLHTHLFVLAVLLFPLAANGQAVFEEDIPEVVVTATRLETPAEDVSGTIMVITSEDIVRKQAGTVGEALRGLPGADLVNQGGLGKSSSVLLRGGDARFTLVLIDGVEVNDPSNPERTFDFAHMDTGDIDRIEVLFGPQSTLYGSDAVGGVIQIITKKGKGRPKVEVAVETGAFRTHRVQTSVRVSAGRTSYFLSASSVESDGISAAARSDGNTEEDGYENVTLSGSLERQIGKGGSIRLNVRSVDAVNELDYYGGPGGDDPNFTGDAKHLLISGRIGFFITESWETSLKVSSSTHDRNDLNQWDPDRPFTMELDFNGASEKKELVSNLYVGSRSIVTIGLDSEEETMNSSYFSDEFGTYTSILEEESATIKGVFFQEQYTAGSGFTMTLGARGDDHSRFGGETTWRAGFSAPVSNNLRVRAVYGTGFRAPSIDQLFNPDYGNADLGAERSRGWDAGLQWSPGPDINTSVSWHLTMYDNLIAWYDEDGDPSTWLDGWYDNISRARTEGVDLSFDARAGVWSLGLTGSVLRTEDDQGEQLLRRPETRWGGRLGLEPSESLSVSMEAGYVGDRRDWGDVTLDSYTLVTLAGSFRVNKSLQVLGRIENLTDEEYEEADGYGTPGRSAYFGVKAEL